MHFLVLAWDFPTADGVTRRDATRPAHAISIRELWEEGRVVLGAGLLDNDGVVRGSMVVVDYPTRDGVNEYLASEPFAIDGVWDRVDVHPLRLPDFYLQGRPG